MAKIYLNLEAQLSQFGLNPQDWRIHHIEKDLFHITNNEDREFTFVGEIDWPANQFPCWRKLELASI